MNGIVSLFYDNSSYTADLVFNGDAGLDITSDLSTTVTISLFTWRRDDSNSPRYGWWGDSYTLPSGRKIGSRLWTLRKKTITQATLINAKGIIKESLSWMVSDGIAKSVDVEVSRLGLQSIAAKVTITRKNNTTWANIWEVHLDAI